jgi:hypothetical protein
MPSLPRPANYNVTYNGFQFPVEADTQAHFVFVPDAAHRTIVQTTITLTVTARIIAGAGQDASLNAIRAALERPGGSLVVTGIGLGILDINSANPGTRHDLAFGPIPRTLNFKNIGAGIAADVVWQVEVAVIGCLGAADSGTVMEFTTQPSIITDNGGYTTRTISGSLRIPMTRQGVNNPAIPDCADNYFEQYLPPPVPGFARTITHTLSRDRATLDFTATDTELPGNPLPAGIVSATATQTHTCSQRGALVQWYVNLNASYEVARDKPRGIAKDAFVRLVADRVNKLRADGWHMFFPTGMTIGEPELYGKQAATFSLTFMTFKDGIAQDAVSVFTFPLGGLWTSTPDTWDQHAASLATGAQAPRGNAQARIGRDQIVDLCLAGSGFTGSLTAPPAIGTPAANPDWTDIKNAIGFPNQPNPATTWLEFSCVSEVEEINRLHTHFPLPTGPDDGTTSTLRTPNFGGSPGTFPQTADPFALAAQTTPAPMVQGGGSPGYYIRLIGRALRFSYEIPRLTCPTVGGQQPVDANNPKLGTFWRSGLVGWTVAPIFAATWNLRYFVPRPYGQQSNLLPVLPHPWQQQPTPVR